MGAIWLLVKDAEATGFMSVGFLSVGVGVAASGVATSEIAGTGVGEWGAGCGVACGRGFGNAGIVLVGTAVP